MKEKHYLKKRNKIKNIPEELAVEPTCAGFYTCLTRWDPYP
jgi:hypothetical protein